MKINKNICIFFCLIFSTLGCAGTTSANEAAVQNAVETAGADWLSLVRSYPLSSISADKPADLAVGTLAEWWNIFGDELLTDLIRLSFQNNRDLQGARARVLQARAQLGVSKAALLPWLDGRADWTNADASKNGAAVGGSSNTYGLGIDASWEIDLFGQKREEVRAGKAALESEYASLHDVWVTLSSEVALHYVSLRTLQERLKVAQDNLRIQTDTYEMLQSLHDVGLRDALDVQQALYTLESTKASIPSIEQSIEETLNQIAILTGDVPGSLNEVLAERRALPALNMADFIGIPAEALRQRPDIRAAERLLASQVAKRKVAEKDRLPKLSLIGSIGLESLSSGSLFSSNSYGFSIGPQITLPIFHGGAIRKNIQVQSAKEEEYLANYEQTVLNAAAEVRDALTANAKEARRNESLCSAVTAAKSALQIAEDQYRQGLTDFNNVLDALQALASLEDDYAVSQGQKMTNAITLFKALGGGWEPLYRETAAQAAKKRP